MKSNIIDLNLMEKVAYVVSSKENFTLNILSNSGNILLQYGIESLIV